MNENTSAKIVHSRFYIMKLEAVVLFILEF